MMDKLMEKLMESATTVCMPKLEEIAKVRKSELEDMKVKVRSHPEQVEAWFEKEIAKLGNIDVAEMLGKVK
jgi:3-methyladenine DNA glycosylase AlkD